MVELVLKDSRHQACAEDVKLFTSNILKLRSYLQWTLDQTQMIVIADATFPRQNLLFGKLDYFWVDKTLKGFVLLRSVPVLSHTHDKERYLWVTNLCCRY